MYITIYIYGGGGGGGGKDENIVGQEKMLVTSLSTHFQKASFIWVVKSQDCVVKELRLSTTFIYTYFITVLSLYFFIET